MTFITQLNWSRLTAALLAAVLLVSLNFGAATPVSADETTTWTLKRFQPLSEVQKNKQKNKKNKQVKRGDGVSFFVKEKETGRALGTSSSKQFRKGTFNGEEGRRFEVQVSGVKKNTENSIFVKDTARQLKRKNDKCCRNKGFVRANAAVRTGEGEVLSATAGGATSGPNFGAATPVKADDTTTWTLRRFQPLSEVPQNNQVRKGEGVEFFIFELEGSGRLGSFYTEQFTKGTFNGEEGRWFEVQVSGVKKNTLYGVKITDGALQHKNKKKRNGTFKCCKDKPVYFQRTITDGSGEITSSTATGASYGPQNWFDSDFRAVAHLEAVEKNGEVIIHRAR